MQKFTRAQKGKYLVMLFEEGNLDVNQDSDLFHYLTQYNFKTEYMGCYCGSNVIRFYAPLEKKGG